MDRVVTENSKWKTFRILIEEKMQLSVVSECFLAKKLQNAESIG